MKSNLELVAFCKKHLGAPYWYGTFGLVGTEKILQEKARQYPKYMTPKRVAYARQHHIGKRTFDCVGLIKGFIWWNNSKNSPIYNGNQDVSAGGMRERCKQHGPMSTLPEIPGTLVFIGGRHVGVYIGNGKVIEAKGFDYGCVMTDVHKGQWDSWGMCPYIKYVPSPGDIPITKTPVKPPVVKPPEKPVFKPFMVTPKAVWLNIRVTPNGASTGKRFVFKDMSQVKAIKKDAQGREWYHISTKTGIGWVAGWLCRKL